jgi:hypothetical protein
MCPCGPAGMRHPEGTGPRMEALPGRPRTGERAAASFFTLPVGNLAG